MCTFDDSKNKYYVSRGKNCMKTCCEFLKEYAIKIINIKKENDTINKQKV